MQLEATLKSLCSPLRCSLPRLPPAAPGPLDFNQAESCGRSKSVFLGGSWGGGGGDERRMGGRSHLTRTVVVADREPGGSAMSGLNLGARGPPRGPGRSRGNSTFLRGRPVAAPVASPRGSLPRAAAGQGPSRRRPFRTWTGRIGRTCGTSGCPSCRLPPPGAPLAAPGPSHPRLAGQVREHPPLRGGLVRYE